MNDCLLNSDGSGTASIVVSNASLSTQALQKGMHLLGKAAVNLIEMDTGNNVHGLLKNVSMSHQWWR